MNCLIYSGFTRNWETDCKQNHKDTFGDAVEIHHNEYCADLNFYDKDIFGYSSNLFYNTFGDGKLKPDNVPHRVLNMWHNMWQAFIKAPKGLNVYVRMRYDTLFDKPINLDSYQLADNRVYIPLGIDWRDGLNDWTAFGNYEAMCKYYSVFLTHQMLFHQGLTFHPESYLKYTMDHFGIEVVRITQTNKLIGGITSLK